jgi:hypothetical protein
MLMIAALMPYPARADMYPDPTGIWYVPGEPGWGATIFQQANKMFVVLAVHDDQGRPAWYAASDVRQELVPGSGVPPFFSGTLYRTTASSFSAPFDPTQTRTQPVGTLDLSYSPFLATGEIAEGQIGRSLILAYTVDGTFIHKEMQALAWDSAGPTASGRYSATMTVSAPPGCEGREFFPLQLSLLVLYGLSNNEQSLTLNWQLPGGVSCSIWGPFLQRGQIGQISGDFACIQDSASTFTEPLVLPVEVSSVTFTRSGFLAEATLRRPTCSATILIGGVRMPVIFGS